MYTPETTQILSELLTDKIDDLRATKLHLTHQLSLHKKHRVITYGDDELERAIKELSVVLIPLEKALKEFKNGQTEILPAEGYGNPDTRVPNQ